MNFAPNLPKQPTNYESKLNSSLQSTGRFIKSLMYLTKKVFML